MNELKIRSIKYNKVNNNIFYFGGWDSNLYIYDEREGAIVQKWEDCPTVESDSISTSTNGKYIAVCGLNKIKIFDTRMKSDD